MSINGTQTILDVHNGKDQHDMSFLGRRALINMLFDMRQYHALTSPTGEAGRYSRRMEYMLHRFARYACISFSLAVNDTERYTLVFPDVAERRHGMHTFAPKWLNGSTQLSHLGLSRLLLDLLTGVLQGHPVSAKQFNSDRDPQPMTTMEFALLFELLHELRDDLLLCHDYGKAIIGTFNLPIIMHASGVHVVKIRKKYNHDTRSYYVQKTAVGLARCFIAELKGLLHNLRSEIHGQFVAEKEET